MGLKLDTTSQDRRIRHIHMKTDLMTNGEMEKELVVHRNGGPRTMD